jgi:hypothetical protein
MTLVKAFGILVEDRGEGRKLPILPKLVIAEIESQTQTLPLINSDDADWAKAQRGDAEESRDRNREGSPETHAKLGCLGMTLVKAFGILVEARGKGVRIAGIPPQPGKNGPIWGPRGSPRSHVIAVIGRTKPYRKPTYFQVFPA